MNYLRQGQLLAIGLALLTMLLLSGRVWGQENIQPNQTAPLNQPIHRLNYQGYLTDNLGTPLNGNYELQFSLYYNAAPSTATFSPVRIWGPESHSKVPIQQGLFNVVLGETLELAPIYFKQMLYLQVVINDAAMPLQPLHVVPYSFGVLPGAVIEGAPTGTLYGLSVINTHVDLDTSQANQGRGIWAQGWQYGMVAQETGPGEVAILSTSYVEAQGYKSHEPSYWWVNGMTGLAANPDQLRLTPTLTGTAMLTSAVTGTQLFYLPLNVPGLMYGQEVAVPEVTLYYRSSHTTNVIAAARLEKQVNVDASETLFNQSLQLAQTTPASYTLISQGNYTLTAESGALNLQLTLNFADPSQAIYIGGVRVRLEHHD